MRRARGERHNEALKLNSPFLFMVQSAAALISAAQRHAEEQRLHSGLGSSKMRRENILQRSAGSSNLLYGQADRHQTSPCQTLTSLFIKQRCTYRSTIREQGRIISVSASTMRCSLIHSVEHGECKHTPLYHSWTDWIAAIYHETQQWRMEMFSSSAACHCHGNGQWTRRTRSKHNSHSVLAMNARWVLRCMTMAGLRNREA